MQNVSNLDEFQELEYKYDAKGVELQDFKDLMKKLDCDSTMAVASWDTYYSKKDSSQFLRFRDGQKVAELTIKQKTEADNNYHRIEIDLPLDTKKVTQEIVDKFAAIQDYDKNFQIYKMCFVYVKDHVNFVYYIVFNKQMQEIGKFIEVELNKGKTDEIPKFKEICSREWEGVVSNYEVQTPLSYLSDMEKELECLGITSSDRMTKSLFELYKK